MESDLYRKLEPQHFPNLDLQVAAILGFLLERESSTPTLAEVRETPDSCVLAYPAEESGVGHGMHLGVEADLRANRSRIPSLPR